MNGSSPLIYANVLFSPYPPPSARHTLTIALAVIPIPRQNFNVDLGITITDKLSFETHIDSNVFEARPRISVIFRGFFYFVMYI